ncbi:MAG: hypothetical protein AAF514_19265, partial [Verrucomicrobiota bacterium]
MGLDLSTSLAELPEVAALSPKARTGLKNLHLVTVRDLLTHFPRRHEDRHRFHQFPNQTLDHAVCITGIVTDTATKRFG